MRRGSIAALIGLSWSSAAITQGPDWVSGFRVLDAVDPCRESRPADEIVVCGNRREGDRYRVPERPAAGAGPVRGEAPRASAAAPAASGGCGIFQGQSRCSEAEMAEFGYGRGRDPFTFVTRLVAKLADPEGDSHFQARRE